MVDGMNSLSVSKGFDTSYPYTVQEGAAYLEKVKEKRNKKSIYYAVVLKETKEVVGGGGIYFKYDRYSVGIWLRDDKQKMGFGKEILSGAIEYAFDVMNVEILYGFYYEWNTGSKKLSDYFGFELVENDLPKYILNDEEVKKCVRLDRSKYKRLQPNAI
ncbi:MAG: GNAT family N-acetyltransferase [Roseburia sp.]|nr:GNAT family N-acetyltransferase [Roseburia sp.]